MPDMVIFGRSTSAFIRHNHINNILMTPEPEAMNSYGNPDHQPESSEIDTYSRLPLGLDQHTN